MKLFPRKIFILAVAFVVLSFSHTALAQQRIAGIIEEITGPAYWRKDNRAKEIKLDARHLGRILHVGEQVRVGPKGRLRLFLCSGKQDVTKSSWFPISLPDECPNQAALAAYGDVGGRDRGNGTQIFSPSDHSVVWPGQFVIRWIPSTAKCIVSFSISEVGSYGSDIWTENDIDGSLGKLDSDKARSKLQEYRERSGDMPLRLRMTDSCANDLTVTFSLISTKNELALTGELTHWDKNSGTLMFHLGRAYVLEKYRIFPAVAEEYEAALKKAPESHDLLSRAIQAHRATGNYIREAELKKRLPAQVFNP